MSFQQTMWSIGSPTRQQLWSRYQDILSSCASCRTWPPDMFELLIVVSRSSSFTFLPRRVRASDGILHWGKTQRYSHPWYLLRSWTFQVSGITTVCHQMVQHNITLPWMWQYHCQGIFSKYIRYHWNTASTDQWTIMLEPLHVQKRERFVVIMCSKGCGLAKVNEHRHRLFHVVKRLWRTYHSLKQLCLNMKRDLCFIPAFTGSQQPPLINKSLISGNAGSKTDTIVFCLPYWTTFEDASKSFSILLHGSCERSWTGSCTCTACYADGAGVRSTWLCTC